MKAALLRPVLLAILISLMLVNSGFGPPTLIESESASTPITSQTLKALKSVRPPQVAAKAAVVIDAVSGEVAYEKNSHAHRAPASTTKMMTALVTLEKSRLDEVVTAGPNVKVEPTIIGLDPGDTLTVEQLLYGLLLPSGNDAAVDLAEHVGGSIPQFATMMNAKVAQLGLKDTHFVNPHGLDVEGHYSSAYDLSQIARAGFANPTFEKVVGTKELRVQGAYSWLFRNNNKLLFTYPGADGVKTGYTDNAGRCLVFSATRDGHRAISVVLDSDYMYEDSAALLDYFFANYGWQTVNPGSIPLSEYGQGDGLRHTVAKTNPVLSFPAWQKPYLRWFYSMSPNPTPGGVAGTATYYLFGKKVAEIDLLDEGN